MATALALTQRRQAVAEVMGGTAGEICDILRSQFPDITRWQVYGDLKHIQAEMAHQLGAEITPSNIIDEYQASMFKAWADFQHIIDTCPANQPAVAVGAIKGQMKLTNDYVDFLLKMNKLKATDSIVDMRQIPQIGDILNQLQAMPSKQVIGFYAVAFGLAEMPQDQALIADDSTVEGEFHDVTD